MAITCPTCGKEFDVTLFQFGNAVECDCGITFDISVGHCLDADTDADGSSRSLPADATDPKKRLPEFGD